ncbi:hypothetical protein QC823_15875 [Halomonas vilamensis]|uniref:Uncharacterized protein n=1 Tax=Vreelandella vilamensis TaxID=531309 RepID=A0ABU1H805_9GAMM|nr:hypothetical protein [Halomonas vilamensis]MDR5900442.1 hypothetical protein [Halomonas vilamensis]
MIGRAYDEQHPPFLRQPTLDTLREGMDKLFPGLKPAGVDDNGEKVYALADIAHALEVSEAELLEHAEQRGMTSQLQRQSVHRIH